jgi:tubulin-folding cofactor B
MQDGCVLSFFSFLFLFCLPLPLLASPSYLSPSCVCDFLTWYLVGSPSTCPFSQLRFHVTHSSSPLQTEKRFDPDMTITNLKTKLYPLSGTAPQHQVLQLMNPEGTVLATLEPDEMRLKDFPIFDYARIHIIDTDPSNTVAQYADVSKVEKFEISEQAYEAKQDTFRNFKKTVLKDHVAKVEEEKAEAAKRREEQEALEVTAAAAIQVGLRCQVEGNGRGAVQFVGPVDFQPGVWVGIKLDEPTGKNDGTVKDRKYFECNPNYGLFAKPTKVGGWGGGGGGERGGVVQIGW